MNTQEFFPRRNFLKTAAVGLAAGFSGQSLARANTEVHAVRKPPLRVIHMTDHHLMDFMNERGSSRGIEAAFAHALTLNPDLIANGGDLLTHSIERPLRDVKKDARTILKMFPERGPRIINACGNHDIWGWNRKKSGASGRESLFGKNFFLEYFGEGELYRSIDLGSWTMLVLDSVQPWENGYQGGLDDEQFEWLEGELRSADPAKPIIVLSHVPILSAGLILQDARLGPPDDHARGVTMPKGSCHQDLWRVADAFWRHGNVKIVLSGHVHVDERIDILGTSYISGGAVCGSWWIPREQMARRATLRERDQGNPHLIRTPRADPGFAVFDLYPDGKFDYEYVLFPWEFVRA